jgi:hypothetical protein
LERINPYVRSYFDARDTLKSVYLSGKYTGKPINLRM